MEKFNGVLRLNAKLMTPMAQMAQDGKLKTRTFVIPDAETVEGKKTIFVDVPIYSGNAIGGMLRRAATYVIFKKALEKGFIANIAGTSKGSNIHDNDLLKLYFLYSVGGGSVIRIAAGDGSNEYASYRVVKELRESNPFISLFGMTLNIHSKLVISDLLPIDVVNNETDKEMIIEAVNSILSRRSAGSEEQSQEHSVWIGKNSTRYGADETIVVVDDIIRDSIYTKLFLTEDVKKNWVDFTAQFSSNQKEAESQKKDKDKKQTIQNIQDMPYIPAGAVMNGEIAFKEPLTMPEYGLILESLKVLAQQSLTDVDGNKYRFAFGSFGKRGFGRVKLGVRRVVESGSVVDILGDYQTANIFDIPQIDINDVEDLESDALEEFSEWLENLNEEILTLPLRYTQVNKQKESQDKGKKKTK